MEKTEKKDIMQYASYPLMRTSSGHGMGAVNKIPTREIK